jgi:hypothetical protein
MDGDNRIRSGVTVCGRKACRKTQAVVDTGSTTTVITRELARQIGAPKGMSVGLGTVGGSRRAEETVARLCVRDKHHRGGGCMHGRVLVVDGPDFGPGGANVLIGQDYLSAAKAKIDTVSKRIRFKMRKRLRAEPW